MKYAFMSSPNMTKSSELNTIATAALTVIVGIVAFVFTQSIFDLFFVPIVVLALWTLSDKVSKLEKRLASLESEDDSQSAH